MRAVADRAFTYHSLNPRFPFAVGAPFPFPTFSLLFTTVQPEEEISQTEGVCHPGDPKQEPVTVPFTQFTLRTGLCFS